MKEKILDFLEKIGVDIRFISLWNKFVFINNLKFSRFSRRREELFQAKFPEWKVIRSKVFQKMCIRASRILSKSLNPGDKIFIVKNSKCTDLALYLILEPYTRKYGIEIITKGDVNSLEKDHSIDSISIDSIASSITLDQEIGNIIHQMFQGEKILPTNRNAEFNGVKIIYPLINIPETWTESWAEKYNLCCKISPKCGDSADFIRFLEEFIPDVRENMLKSAWYVSEMG